MTKAIAKDLRGENVDGVVPELAVGELGFWVAVGVVIKLPAPESV